MNWDDFAFQTHQSTVLIYMNSKVVLTDKIPWEKARFLYCCLSWWKYISASVT